MWYEGQNGNTDGATKIVVGSTATVAVTTQKSRPGVGNIRPAVDLLKSRVFIKSPAVGNCYRTVVNKINSNLKVLKLKIVCI